MLENARQYQRGLRAWAAGEETEEAIAAGENLVEVLALIRSMLTKKG